MVLNGMQSMKQRSSESRRLMDLMFREFKLYRFYGQDEAVDRANVWLGTQSKIDLVLKEPLELVLARSDRRKLKVSVQWTDPVPAPIRAGQTVGTLVLELPSGKTSYELLAARDVAALGMFDRVGEALKYLIFGASVDDPVLGQ